MKYILIFLSLLPYNLFSQLPLQVSESGIVYMEKVILAPGQSKDSLYLKVLDWYAETFKDPSSVITFNDREIGKVNGNYVAEYEVAILTFFPFSHSVSVQVKDERLKIVITNIVCQANNASLESYILRKDDTFRDMYSELQKSLKIELNYLIKSLEISINQPADKSESW